MKNIFCFGFGQVAKYFIKKLKSENFSFNLSTTSREKTRNNKFENIEYKNFYLKNDNFDKDLLKELKKANYILVSVPPIDNNDIVIKTFKEQMNSKNIEWITYLSATSVYGNHYGEWVNEKSSTNPTSKNGVDRLKAEKLWLDLSNQINLPLQIFRLSGIYSYQFNSLRRVKNGEAKIIKKKNHFFSRIHVEDIANILFKSLKIFKRGEIFNISDDKPSSNEEVIKYCVKISGAKLPETIETNMLSDLMQNFYKDSKKVDNKKMKNFFNYNLKYPTYEEGLSKINKDFI